VAARIARLLDLSAQGARMSPGHGSQGRRLGPVLPR
jgi:hypothetical protein